MSTKIRDRNHAEAITRDSARALGIDTHDFVWDARIGGIVNTQTHMAWAPLNHPADAYLIETTLCINVLYRTVNGTTLMQMARGGNGGSICYTMQKDDDVVRRRMEAATVFGALCAIEDDAAR